MQRVLLKTASGATGNESGIDHYREYHPANFHNEEDPPEFRLGNRGTDKSKPRCSHSKKYHDHTR